MVINESKTKVMLFNTAKSIDILPKQHHRSGKLNGIIETNDKK